jgi:hypothetical protein
MSALKPDSKEQSLPDPPPHRPMRGRPFQKGNGGRKPGSRNRTTVMAQALLEGDMDALRSKGRELALAGNTQMLIFFLNRMQPKERCVRIDLPELDRSSDAVDALAIVIRAAATGQISPSEAAAFTSMIANYARTINIAEYEERLTKIEEQLRGQGSHGSNIAASNRQNRRGFRCTT